MADYAVFTLEGGRKVAEATGIVRGQPRNVLNVPFRPGRVASGSGSCDCLTVHEIRFDGAVTGGTVILDVGIDDGGGVDVENVTLNWDDTAAEVQTAYEGHSSIAASGADITVKGGGLPDGAVYIVFKSTGNLNRNQPIPTVDTNSLTGTNVRIKTGYMTNVDWEA